MMHGGVIEHSFAASCEIRHIGMSLTESKHHQISELTYCDICLVTINCYRNENIPMNIKFVVTEAFYYDFQVHTSIM